MAILGIDEVGRGPLAGPLVVGAVVLPEAERSGDATDEASDGSSDDGISDDGASIQSGRPEWVEELKDSKKLSARKRAALSEIIWQEALAVGLGWVTPMEIDELGMSGALRLATRRAVEEVQRCFAVKRGGGDGGATSKGDTSVAGFSQIVIDGKVNFLADTALSRYVSTMVKADDLVKEVSAASIVAKHARDMYMITVDKQWPEYGFSRHMGYGTAAHREALLRLGPCPEHRRSFAPVSGMVGFRRGDVVADGSVAAGGDGAASRENEAVGNVLVARKNTTEVGRQGEAAVCEYLQARGHRIVARNFRTYYYEIDIVSVCEERMYFTEVKTRRDSVRGGGLAAVDAAKLSQMRYAAECYLHYQGLDCDAVLAVAAVGYDVQTGKCEVEDFIPLKFS